MQRWACALGLLSLACSSGAEDVRLPPNTDAPGFVIQLDDAQGTRHFVLGNENRGFEVLGDGQFTLHALGSSAEALQLQPGPLDGFGERALPVLQSYLLTEAAQWDEVGTAEPLSAPLFDDTACGAACIHRTQCDFCVGEPALYSVCAPCEANLVAEAPVFAPHVCPDGWRAQTFDDGHRNCEPREPEGVRTSCPADERYDLATESCQPVAPCLPPVPDIPAGWSVDYVDAQAPDGGLGTLDRPRNVLRRRYRDTVVVIQSGRYDSGLYLDANVHLVGAGTCTVLVSSSTATPAVRAVGPGIQLRTLALEGLQPSSSALLFVPEGGEADVSNVSFRTGERKILRSLGAVSFREVRAESSTRCIADSQCEALATLEASQGSLFAEGLDVVSAVGLSAGRIGGTTRPGADVEINNARFLGVPSGGGVGLSVDLGALRLRNAWFVDQGQAGINIDHVDTTDTLTAFLTNVHIRGRAPDFGSGPPPVLSPRINGPAGMRVVTRGQQPARTILTLRQVSIIGQRQGLSTSDVVIDAQDLRISDVGVGMVLEGEILLEQTHMFDRLWIDYYGGAGIGLLRGRAGDLSLSDAYLRDSCGDACPTLSTLVPGGGVAVLNPGSSNTRLDVSQSHFLPSRASAFSAFIEVFATDVAVRSPRGPPIRINILSSGLHLERVLFDDLQGPALSWTGNSEAKHLSMTGAGPLLCLHEGALGTLEQFHLRATSEGPVIVLSELNDLVLQSNDFTIKQGLIERPASQQSLVMKSEVIDCSTAFRPVQSSLMSDVRVVVRP